MGNTPSATPQFREIYDRHVGSVRRYCYRRLPAADVDDAIAEVFLVVWRRFGRMPGGDDTILWLYGIARNVVRNQTRSLHRVLRLRGRLSSVPGRTAEDVAVQVVRRLEEQKTLDALAAMRPDDQEVLRLAAWEGLKPAAIGRVLGIEPHAASMRLQRARRRLAHLLDMEEEEQDFATYPRPVSKGGER